MGLWYVNVIEIAKIYSKQVVLVYILTSDIMRVSVASYPYYYLAAQSVTF